MKSTNEEGEGTITVVVVQSRTQSSKGRRVENAVVLFFPCVHLYVYLPFEMLRCHHRRAMVIGLLFGPRTGVPVQYQH
jgi:hypothetical protein